MYARIYHVCEIVRPEGQYLRHHARTSRRAVSSKAVTLEYNKTGWRAGFYRRKPTREHTVQYTKTIEIIVKIAVVP
jgi:hypothetical protein